MANTSTPTALRVQQWDSDFFVEFLRNNRFAPYMGRGTGAIIRTREQLMKQKGDKITFPFVELLDGDGKKNNERLAGAEESLGQHGHQLTVDLYRHGVVVTEMEEIKSAIDIRDASKESLRRWRANLQRNKMIDALFSPVIDGFTIYGSATTGQKDAWAVANQDRVRYGAAKANWSGVHATDLAKIDTTNDLVTPNQLSALKEYAENGDPHLTPYMTDEDEEMWVVFMGSRLFRDISQHATMTQANRDARVRGKDNPVFRGGDLLWNSMLIRHIPEITTRCLLTGVGDSGSSVEPVFLCGAGALAYGIAKRPFTKTRSDDYDNENGVAIGEIFGVEKMMYKAGKQHGVVTGFFSASATA
jgi:N4-gp56 family major capsid protein